MKKILKSSFILFTAIFVLSFADPKESFENSMNKTTDEMITYIPPKGWKSLDLDGQSPLIKSIVIGPSKSHFPPSLTLAIEPYKGTLKDYLKVVKEINKKEKTEWKDLGKIQTKASEASLSQYDEESNWGITRTMTTIFVRNGNAYILSATALKSEFSDFYTSFFNAISSIEFVEVKK